MATPPRKRKPLSQASEDTPPPPPPPRPPRPPSPPSQEISIPNEDGGDPLDGIIIVPNGDVVLDVTFETSNETIKAARKADAARLRGRPGQTAIPPSSTIKPSKRILYRTRISVLKQHSKYFTLLLGDPSWAEAKLIEAAFERLSLQKVNPSQADIKDLPRVKINVDDDYTHFPNQDAAFEDLLRMLHGQVITTNSVTMPYLSTLAVLADRFECAEPVSKSLHGQLKFKIFKWPATQVRASKEEDGVALTKAAEDVLRQKIFVSWRLDLPLRFQKATGELIMYGSRQWREFADEESGGSSTAWWYLPDELESELKHRRTCILNTIASIPHHFITLYATSRTRQCKLGYDSSASCDSYQLGETIKFLLKRNLLSLTYFSSSSFSPSLSPSHSTIEIPHILATLKQFPSYQIDKNHTNCGPRTLLKPILDFISTLLSSKLVSISRHEWIDPVRRGESASWQAALFPPYPPLTHVDLPGRGDDDCEIIPREGEQTTVFRFTRSMASDQRLQLQGSLGADRLVRAVFTADEWDWTPES